MAQEKILLVISDIQLGKLLSDGILRPGGFQVTLIDEISFASSVLDSSKYDLLIIEEKSSDDGVQRIVENTLKKYPNLSIIMVSHLAIDMERMRVALQLGVTDYLELPLKPSNVVQAVRNGLERRRRIDKWSSTKVARQTGSLIKQVDSLKELEIIGRSVTASLDLDHVLKVIVDAAVNLTGSEEGSLLVLDENSGELVMRASRNFQDEFVRTFRLPVSDTLAGQVVKTGLPILLNGDTPQKIKTTYLVRTIMYVPMKIHGKVIGVLGVDNREKGQPFSQRHLTLVSTLADYAAIAIEKIGRAHV